MAELPILHPGSVAGSQAKEARPMFNTEKIIRLPTVLARTGLSRSTLYRKIAEGTFPAQVRISVHGAGWHESAVNRWIADPPGYRADRSEEHTSELQSLMRNSYAVFCLKKKNTIM